jgi:MFS family permease
MTAGGGRLQRAVAHYRGFQPDARRFLLVTLVGGAATSLWWIDFNLYLRALGFDAPGIGIVATVSSTAAALAAFPASSLSDRVGRRVTMIAGATLGLVAVAGLIAFSDPAWVLVLAAAYSMGNQAVQVVAVPYMSEHSLPEHRSELFALQYATVTATNIVAAALGGIVANGVASTLGLPPGGPDTYRIILAFMVVLFAASLAMMVRLRDDRPSRTRPGALLDAGEPARFPTRRTHGVRRIGLGLVVRDRRTFVRLLLPGFLISLGAGQVIPFLNLFIQTRFGLDLAALNGVFALTSIGTMLAILYQPTLARRFGRVQSVIIVQAASIPFLVVLGFSPVLWSVIVAMAVRNSLMNAGNPIANAFAMDRVSPPERATLAAAMSLEWSVGWVIAGAYYTTVQRLFGFDLGYTVDFITIIVLYTVATVLYWRWFRDAEPAAATRSGGTAATAGVTD